MNFLTDTQLIVLMIFSYLFGCLMMYLGLEADKITKERKERNNKIDKVFKLLEKELKN
jgi:hypothetical protein